MSKSRYIHTIEGKPACYDGRQISFAGNGTKLSNLLVEDLKTIRLQQKLSAEGRQAQGFEPTNAIYKNIDYLRVSNK